MSAMTNSCSGVVSASQFRGRVSGLSARVARAWLIASIVYCAHLTVLPPAVHVSVESTQGLSHVQAPGPPLHVPLSKRLGLGAMFCVGFTSGTYGGGEPEAWAMGPTARTGASAKVNAATPLSTEEPSRRTATVGGGLMSCTVLARFPCTLGLQATIDNLTRPGRSWRCPCQSGMWTAASCWRSSLACSCARMSVRHAGVSRSGIRDGYWPSRMTRT